MSIQATGLLAEVEERKPYTNKRTGEIVVPRDMHVVNGRFVDTFEVSGKLNGEVDALVGRHVVCTLRYTERWRDVGSTRIPDRKLVCIAVEEHPALPLENAA
jgi:hypothetical protein